jgi:hypothetical protein
MWDSFGRFFRRPKTSGTLTPPPPPDLAFLANPANQTPDTLRYNLEAIIFLYDFLYKNGHKDSPHTRVLESLIKHFDRSSPDLDSSAIRKVLSDLAIHFQAEDIDRFFRKDVFSKLVAMGSLPQDGSSSILQFVKIIFISVCSLQPSLFRCWWRTKANPKTISLPAERILCALIRRRYLIPLGNQDMRSMAICALLFLYGPIGSSLFFCSRTAGGQLSKEVGRLLGRDLNSLVSNYFLFIIAANLESSGYRIAFVPETPGKKTPDLEVSKAGRTHFIEVTVKRPYDEAKPISDSIQSGITEKQEKFTDPRFHPGIICIDISTHANQNDTAEIDPKFLTSYGGCKTYDLVADMGFWSNANNLASALAKNVSAFRAIDRPRCNVAVLFTAALRVVEFDPENRNCSHPRRANLIAERRCGIHIPWEMGEGVPIIYLA